MTCKHSKLGQTDLVIDL